MPFNTITDHYSVVKPMTKITTTVGSFKGRGTCQVVRKADGQWKIASDTLSSK